MGEPGEPLVHLVQRAAIPTMLLHVPSEDIVAASDEAARLIGVPLDELVGRNLEDFATDAPTGALPLLSSGRLTGYEAERKIRHDGGVGPLHLWIRAAGSSIPVAYAIAVLWPAGRGAWRYLPCPPPDEAAPVVGTINGRLEVVTVSEDVHVLGLSAADVVGTSVFRLVDDSSAADVLQALAEAARSGRAVAVTVNAHLDGRPIPCELLLRPLVPSPSFSFSFLCQNGSNPSAISDEGRLTQAGRGLHALALAETLRLLDDVTVPGSTALSTREIEIVARLLAGDRVPAIANGMYLSSSTVRNHLSRAFRKLGVTSQQELIELFRESAHRLHNEGNSTTSN